MRPCVPTQSGSCQDKVSVGRIERHLARWDVGWRDNAHVLELKAVECQDKVSVVRIERQLARYGVGWKDNDHVLKLEAVEIARVVGVVSPD